MSTSHSYSNRTFFLHKINITRERDIEYINYYILILIQLHILSIVFGYLYFFFF